MLPLKLLQVTITSPSFKGFKKKLSFSTTISAKGSSIEESLFSQLHTSPLPESNGALAEFKGVAFKGYFSIEKLEYYSS